MSECYQYLKESPMTTAQKGRLWKLLRAYVKSCGGNPDSTRKGACLALAVAAVQKSIDKLMLGYSDPMRLYCIREALVRRGHDLTWEKAYQEIQALNESRGQWRARWEETEKTRRDVTDALDLFDPDTGAPLRARWKFEDRDDRVDVTWTQLIKAIEMLREERDSLAAAVASQEFHEDFNDS